MQFGPSLEFHGTAVTRFCLSVPQSIYLWVCLSVRLTFHVCQSVCLSLTLCRSFYLSPCLSIYLCLSLGQSSYPSDSAPILLSIVVCWSINQLINYIYYISVCLSVRLSVCRLFPDGLSACLPAQYVHLIKLLVVSFF